MSLGSIRKESNGIYSILVSNLGHRCNYSNGKLDSMKESKCDIMKVSIRGSNDKCKMTFLII